MPDAELLAAVVAVEEEGRGPLLDMKYGRRKGTCSKAR